MNAPHLRNWIFGLGGLLAGVVRRFPLVVMAAIVAAVAAMWMVRQELSTGTAGYQLAFKCLLAGTAGVPLLFALISRSERRGAGGLAANTGGFLVLIVLFFRMPDRIVDQPSAFWFSYFCALASVHFLVAVLPWPEKNSGGFWPWNLALFTRFLESALYAFILWLGLELALGSVDKLFSLKIDQKAYLDVFVFCAAIFHPLFFLAGIRPVVSYGEDRTFPKILKVFTQVVLAPLCAVYAAILYVYGAKILWTHQWPNGWVTAPVLAFAAAGLLAWLLLHPLGDWENDRWARWFRASLPRVLLPLSVLMLFAMRVRIREYGLTEFRVLGLAAGWWLLAFALVYSFSWKRGLRAIPASLALVCILLSAGPVSAPSLSLHSQTKRFDGMLRQIHAGPAKPGPDAARFREDVSNTVRYLIESHGLSALPPSVVAGWKKWRDENGKGAVPADPVQKLGAWTIADEMCQSLGLGPNSGYSAPSTGAGDCVCVGLDGSQPVPAVGARELYVNLSLSGAAASQIAGPFTFNINGDGQLNGAVTTTHAPLDLSAVKAMIAALTPPDTVPNGSHDSTQTPEMLTAKFQSGGETYRLVITHATGHRLGPKGHRHLALDSIDFLIIREQAVSFPSAPAPQTEHKISDEQLVRWLTPFWKGDIVYDESVFLWAADDGMPSAKLLFDATEILSVQDSSQQITYRPGADWKYENNTLFLPPGSRIPWTKASDFYLAQPVAGKKAMPALGGNYLQFSEGSFFHLRQIAVTYRHAPDVWKGPVPMFNAADLPKTLARLKAGQPLKTVAYGDSIIVGANASSFTGVPPWQPKWVELVRLWLEHAYKSQVMLVNKGVGGTNTIWGAQHAAEAFQNQHADLVILHFGMNDRQVVTPEAFLANIKAIMEAARKDNPDVEFILVAPMVNNPKWTTYGNLAGYREDFRSLSGPGVGFVDMMSMHLALLEHKRYEDMTGNNVNHPNDFLSRVYAQVIINTLFVDPASNVGL